MTRQMQHQTYESYQSTESAQSNESAQSKNPVLVKMMRKKPFSEKDELKVHFH